MRMFSRQVLLYSDRLSARGLGAVQPPEQGPGEADGQDPGQDQGQAHQMQQHQDYNRLPEVLGSTISFFTSAQI